uniref:Uncharacterized protein n=1 Tax=Compsopogon caeruleus TaxID=31354 RepID=A0A6T6C323_9RHOD|mmetsp:Transcript_16956/g.35180  ORF Transcript_16956/g.35180 Transcript_16956/m.35180 type:complete len:692 (+) Transcript_16956:29-2104(+)
MDVRSEGRQQKRKVLREVGPSFDTLLWYCEMERLPSGMEDDEKEFAYFTDDDANPFDDDDDDYEPYDEDGDDDVEIGGVPIKRLRSQRVVGDENGAAVSEEEVDDHELESESGSSESPSDGSNKPGWDGEDGDRGEVIEDEDDEEHDDYEDADDDDDDDEEGDDDDESSDGSFPMEKDDAQFQGSIQDLLRGVPMTTSLARESVFGTSVEDIMAQAGSFRQNTRQRTKSSMRLSREAELTMGRANVAYVRGDLEAAMMDLREVIRLQPLAVAPYHTLALILEERGDDERARELLMIAAHKNPGDLDLWKRVANQWYSVGDMERALYCLTRAFKGSKRKDLDSLRARSMIQRDQGRLGKAARGFEVLYRKSKSIIDALSCAECAIQSENWELGERVASLAFEEVTERIESSTLNSTSPDLMQISNYFTQLLSVLSKIYVASGKFSEAKLLLARSSSIAELKSISLPMDIDARKVILQAHSSNDVSELDALLSRVEPLPMRSIVGFVDELLTALYNLGRPDEAKKIIERAESEGFGSTEAMRRVRDRMQAVCGILDYNFDGKIDSLVDEDIMGMVYALDRAHRGGVLRRKTLDDAGLIKDIVSRVRAEYQSMKDFRDCDDPNQTIHIFLNFFYPLLETGGQEEIQPAEGAQPPPVRERVERLVPRILRLVRSRTDTDVHAGASYIFNLRPWMK